MHDKLFKIFTNGTADTLDPTTKRLASVLAYVGVAVLALMAILLAINFWGHDLKGSSLGTFGDFFGGVLNPILAFLTVLGLSVTIVMQRASISASRLQRFETTFFNLLDLHNKIVDGLVFDPSILKDPGERIIFFHISGVQIPTLPTSRGREVFATILTRVLQVETPTNSRTDIYRNELQTDNNHVLGHYFRNLYQILRLADRLEEEAIDVETIQIYTGIVRAQLSANELALLFYNCLKAMVDDGEFKRLIIKYKLLEHLPLKYKESEKKIWHEKLPTEPEYYREYMVTVPAGDSTPATNSNRVPGPLAPGAYGTNPTVHRFILDSQPPIRPRKNPAP